MKGGSRQTVGDQCFAECFAPGRRPAEPDAAAGLEASGDFLRAERSVAVSQATVQIDAGSLAELFELCREVAIFLIRCAVEQIGFGRLRLVRTGEFAEAGEEGRYADATSDPDLVRGLIAAVDALQSGKIKAAIRPFKHYFSAGLGEVGEFVCEITQCLDRQCQGAVQLVPGRGNGKWVSTFAGLAKIGKEELSGAVSWPTGLRAANNFNDLSLVLANGFDLCRILALAANLVAQREQGRDDAGSGERGSQPSQWLLPEASRQHH